MVQGRIVQWILLERASGNFWQIIAISGNFWQTAAAEARQTFAEKEAVKTKREYKDFLQQK